MQIPILAGRDFNERDRPGSPAVTIVNQAFAKANFGDRNPLGQHVILREAGGDNPWRGHADCRRIQRRPLWRIEKEIPPVVYLPYDQGYPHPNQMVYELRTAGDPLRYENAVREEVRRADPRVPVSDMRTQAADIDRGSIRKSHSPSCVAALRRWRWGSPAWACTARSPTMWRDGPARSEFAWRWGRSESA